MINNLKYQCEMQAMLNHESDNNIEVKPTKLSYKTEFIMNYLISYL